MIKKYWFAISVVIIIGAWIVGIFQIASNSAKSVKNGSLTSSVSNTPLPHTEKMPASINYLPIVLDTQKSTASKIKAVDLLTDNLSDLEQEMIFDFIRTSPNGMGEYVVKNNLMNKLVSQKKPIPDMSSKFIKLASDKNQDIVVRAYSVQHLRPLYEINRDPEIKNFLYEALQEVDTEVSGGAMLALNYLSNHDDYSIEFDKSILIQQARKIALNTTANNNNRITAIQIASSVADPELADCLRGIIADHELHSALRISAIAGLGEIGAESDIASLELIANSNKFERRAARAAIKKISNRRSILK